MKSLFQCRLACLLLTLMLGACAQKERAGDITLASPAPVQNNASAVSSGGNSRSSSVNVVSGTNLTSAYGSVSSGTSSNTGTSSSSASNSATSKDIPYSRAEGGIRLPAATASPVAAPVLLTPSAGASSNAVPADTAGTPDAASAANGSSSNLVDGSKIPARSISIVRTKPGCTASDCPSIKVKRLSFTGRERFNNFLDQTMASMAEVDASNSAAFRSLAEFASYFWKISKPGYEVVLEASIKRGDEDLVVVQLDSYIFTGGAHGLSTTQYINWLPKTDKILSLESMLIPKKMPEFEQALKNQHTLWLKTNPQAIENPAAYNKLWPFIPTDHAALLAEGLALTYDPYSIAPYSFGRPTLVIPYSELKGILRPELLPN